MTDDQIRELLREMRDEPVPADALARVRAEVAERTASRQRWRFGWWLVPATAAVMALLLLFAVRARRPEAPPAPTNQVVEVKPTAPPPRSAPAETAKPRLARRAKPRPKPMAAADVAIRIETPDPEVVLIMVTGGGD